MIGNYWLGIVFFYVWMIVEIICWYSVWIWLGNYEIIYDNLCCRNEGKVVESLWFSFKGN